LHPFAAESKCREMKRLPPNFLILIELLDLVFERELVARLKCQIGFDKTLWSRKEHNGSPWYLFRSRATAIAR
jgi:hypothetical protein